MTKAQTKSHKERPRLFRALGRSNPPDTILVDGAEYERVKTIKHDSWAATAMYEPSAHTVGAKIVCKFNRTQPIGPVPMKWLGRRLAEREYQMYHLLRDLPGIARAYRDVSDNGQKLPNACAHEFIEGEPLNWHNASNDDFFDKLDSCLIEMHKRHVAYVDMNKAENVIVNTDGDPCLIDFQISVCWPSPWLRIPLGILQQSDLYHSFKLRRNHRPDLVDDDAMTNARIPWWIRAHRSVAGPFRLMRRRVLVTLGIRKGKGMSQTESFVEEALSGSVSAEQLDEKPILRLHQLLGSEAYVGRFTSNKKYVDQMFFDLFGSTALHPVDSKLVNKIRRTRDHFRVIELLRSKSLFLISHQWDREWIDRKIESIEQSLHSPITQPVASNCQDQAA